MRGSESLQSPNILPATFAHKLIMRKKNNIDGNESGNFAHLKWPAIIILVLVIALVIILDQCSRTGEI